MKKLILFVITFVMVEFVFLSDSWSFKMWAASVANQKEEQLLNPSKVTIKPKIDGILDDEAWKFEPLQEDFITHIPLYGEVLPFKTHIWIAYDSENLFFAFKCFDPDPKKVKTSICKRDDIFSGDWTGISLDAMGARQTAYTFFVNPNGIQEDFLESAVRGTDGAPDFVWESAGQLTEDGYTIEMAVPLSSISFQGTKKVKMGIMFVRKISRLGIIGAWPSVKPGQGLFNTYTPIIYHNLKTPLKLELLPCVVVGNNQQRKSPQEWQKRDDFTEFSLGVKYGLTSSITSEITINPDFSQVESDAFQINVNRRYPLFYREKRPFFMEGSDIFGFFTLASGFLPNPVYTRRIMDPFWGAKITGSLGKSSFGFLAAGDEWPGQTWDSGVNPNEGKQAFFGIARGKYSLGQDNYVGILYSGREFAGEYNRVIGADFAYRTSKDQKLRFSLLQSFSNTALLGDTSGTDFNIQYSYVTRPLEIQGAFEHIGKNFRMDSAYLKRIGINEGYGTLAYNIYPKRKSRSWLKIVSPKIVFQYLHDLTTNMDDSTLDIGMNFSFIKQGTLGLHYLTLKESWQYQTFRLDQLYISGGIQFTKWLTINGTLNYGDKILYEAEPSYKGKGYDGSLTVILQPNENLNQEFDFYYSDFSKDKKKVYEVDIYYSRTTYQFNKYFFLRAVLQYNSYYKRLLTDFLASFTLIPGTVLHVGYGGLYEHRDWSDNQWIYGRGDLLNIKRGFFLKASYLWRF